MGPFVCAHLKVLLSVYVVKPIVVDAKSGYVPGSQNWVKCQMGVK